MNLLRLYAWSTLGKKFLMAVTGIGLIIFLIGHLAGNLLLLVGPESYNSYAHKLIKMGPLLYVVEAGLLGFLFLHMISGISVAIGRIRARPVGYAVSGDAGGNSLKSVSSRTMMYTGLVILAFLVVHIVTFKYGPDQAEGYRSIAHGEAVRDLHRLVSEWFSPRHPWYVAFYIVSMVLLGFHLRHAFWSAFQSLGIYHPRFTPVIYGIGTLLAIVLAVGFLFLPIWFYVRGGTP